MERGRKAMVQRREEIPLSSWGEVMMETSIRSSQLKNVNGRLIWSSVW